MKFATMIKDWIHDRLKPVFVLYNLNKRIKNEIEYQLEMLLDA
jgi:predicted unusual protein kinase regulating ubiquinone biosynthesis (AarF/ABC1/UbiB family)